MWCLKNYRKHVSSASVITGAVLYIQGETLNYTNFEGSSKVTKRRCAVFQVPPYQGFWTSVSCQTYNFCFSCLEREPVVVKIRGLCDQLPADVLFRIEQQEGQMPELRRVFSKSITYNYELNLCNHTISSFSWGWYATFPQRLHQVFYLARW